MNRYDSYLAELFKEKGSIIFAMEEYAEENHVPIMSRGAIKTFLGLLSLQKPTTILEIGSAIGYSAIRMAESFPDTSITTIERNLNRYSKALEFINASGYEDRIRIIQGDALTLDTNEISNKTYDTLFIDAAKGQYKRFFKKYSPFVSAGGVIYCDNMFMHGMVLQDDIDLPRRNRTMIRNLKEFTKWIVNHPEYRTTLIPAGDGILIAKKIEM